MNDSTNNTASVKNLNKVHNLSMNCNTELELSEYLTVLGHDIKTKLAGEHTKIPMYYFKASKSSGKKQDRDGKWYMPEKVILD